MDRNNTNNINFYNSNNRSSDIKMKCACGKEMKGNKILKCSNGHEWNTEKGIWIKPDI